MQVYFACAWLNLIHCQSRIVCCCHCTVRKATGRKRERESCVRWPNHPTNQGHKMILSLHINASNIPLSFPSFVLIITDDVLKRFSNGNWFYNKCDLVSKEFSQNQTQRVVTIRCHSKISVQFLFKRHWFLRYLIAPKKNPNWSAMRLQALEEH